MKLFEKILKFLSSLKLAVVVILSIGVISAIGTVYEAKYDAYYAQQVIYFSMAMYGILGLLCVNLIAVMVDRWPWRPHHAGFVLAHIGIIITLIGALITQRLGVDGTMAFEIGASNRFVNLNDREIAIYSTFDGDEVREMRRVPAAFLRQTPTAQKPMEIAFGGEKISVTQYHHFTDRKSEVVESDRKADGPGLRFQLYNDNVNVVDWLLISGRREKVERDLGPAKVVFTKGAYLPSGQGNEIVVDASNPQKLEYIVFTAKQGKVTKRGVLSEGQEVDTGWMGLRFKVLRHLPLATEKVEYIPRDSASPLAQSAVQIQFRGESYWLGYNNILRLFADNVMYLVVYTNRRLTLDFSLTLKQFNIGRYQGTNRAATYESLVDVPDVGEVLISMNEPLKYKGFTFYQASFEENEKGEPVASILSVNYDPGRVLKYLGSALIVLGTILLFYFKKGRKKGSVTQ